MTPQQVAQELRRLHAAFGNEITPDMGELWANMLSGDEAELVREATDIWIRERTYFPSPAQLREVMRRLLYAHDPPHEPTAIPSKLIAGPEGGFDIAYRAYCEQVVRDGGEPKTFKQFVGLIPIEVNR